MSTKFEEFISDAAQRQLLEREALSLDATELISSLMGLQEVSRSEMATRLATSKAHVTQTLRGSRNMTLHTLADFLVALGHKANIEAFPLEPKHSLQRSSYRISGKPWTLLQPHRHQILRSNKDCEERGAPQEQPKIVA